jgi:predicted phosphodiesterase
MCEERRLVALFDVHVPHNINLEPIIQFIKDFKADILVIGGDFFDAEYWMKVTKGNFDDFMSNKTQDLYDEEMVKCNKILDKLDKAVDKDCRKDYLEGNHEQRLTRILGKFPDQNSSIIKSYDYKRDLRLQERNFNWHSYNQVIKHGRIFLTHGVYCNESHAKKHMLVYGKNIRYGHTHDIQCYSQVSAIDHHERISMSCGCLCKISPGNAPKYLNNRPHKWQNALYTAVINPDGTFHEHLINIIHGKFFRAEGRKYG